MVKFKENLRELRMQKGLSQTQLAESLSISQKTVSSWENGTRQPDYEVLARLADFFEVTTDCLLGVGE